MTHRTRRWIVAPIALLALVAAACGSPVANTPAAPPSEIVDDKGDVSSILDKAKQEGTVVWLTSQPEAIAKGAANAFKAEYGIEVQFLALNSTILQQRYQTEAQSGKISADLISLAPSGSFFTDSIGEGWTQAIRDADLPVMKLGKFPDKYFQGESASIGFVPFLIWYNKSKVTGDKVPTSVEELADPRFKDLLVLTDPSTSDALIQFYDLMHQRYGEEWFEGIRANNPKFYPSASAAVQAVAAGEGGIATPAANAVGQPLIASGAPIEVVSPPVTTGSEIKMILTAPDKAPNPNAGRLFANWLLSESGNKAAQGGVGVSVFDPASLPAGWQAGRVITPEIKQNILELLGL